MIGAGKKRFWTRAEAVVADQGWGVRLDARVLRTPAKAPLEVPSGVLAAAIAQEWQEQQGVIRPESMPMTRLANSAIDKLSRHRAAVIATLAAYGATDLLCYRAAEPERLRLRQNAAWQPWLDWAESRFGARLDVATGLMAIPQPKPGLDALEAEIGRLGNFELAAFHDLVAISGSLILGLAVVQGALVAESAFDLSRLDEAWQIEHWGDDDIASAATEVRRADFLAAFRFMSLLHAA